MTECKGGGDSDKGWDFSAQQSICAEKTPEQPQSSQHMSMSIGGDAVLVGCCRSMQIDCMHVRCNDWQVRLLPKFLTSLSWAAFPSPLVTIVTSSAVSAQ